MATAYFTSIPSQQALLMSLVEYEQTYTETSELRGDIEMFLATVPNMLTLHNHQAYALPVQSMLRTSLELLDNWRRDLATMQRRLLRLEMEILR